MEGKPSSPFGKCKATHCMSTHLLLIEVGKNISSSMHCNIFFPNSISIQKILWINSGKQRPPPPAVPCWMLLGPQQLEAPCPRPRPWPRSRVRGWCATETLLELQRRGADVRRTTVPETVNSQGSRAHPGCCTVCPWVALSSGERGGFSVNILPPRIEPEGRVTAVRSHVRQKCTMQSQKQCHFLSLTLDVYIQFKLELPRGKIYDLFIY